MPVLADVRDHITALAARLDARALDRDSAIGALRDWTAIANAAQTASSLLAARIEQCGPPPSAGARNAAEFIAKETGTTTAQAKSRIETGGNLGKAARTRVLASKGKLSPQQTEAIVDAVAANPAAEDELLSTATTTSLGGLRDACAAKKASAIDVEERERRIHANRSVRRYRDRDGAEHLHATGTKLDMALIDRALKPLVDAQFAAARKNGVREPLEAYTFDALKLMAQLQLEGGQRPRSKSPDPIRHLAVLRIDLSALTRGHTYDGETCEIAGLGPISIAAAREVLGEAVLKLVITKGTDVANVTHLGRGPTIAQKVALLWQQPVCAREGCGRRARLEYDHREDWARTKHTRLDELEPMCDPDHDLKTYEGWALVEGTGVRPMVPPDDPRHPRQLRHRSNRNRPPP